MLYDFTSESQLSVISTSFIVASLPLSLLIINAFFMVHKRRLKAIEDLTTFLTASFMSDYLTNVPYNIMKMLVGFGAQKILAR